MTRPASPPAADSKLALAVDAWVTAVDARKVARAAVAAAHPEDPAREDLEIRRGQAASELHFAAEALKPFLSRRPVVHAGWRYSLDKTGQIHRSRVDARQVSGLNQPGMLLAAKA